VSRYSSTTFEEALSCQNERQVVQVAEGGTCWPRLAFEALRPAPVSEPKALVVSQLQSNLDCVLITISSIVLHPILFFLFILIPSFSDIEACGVYLVYIIMLGFRF
jgi:hypothetical protein